MLNIKQCLQDIANRFNNIFLWCTKRYSKDNWDIIEFSDGTVFMQTQYTHTFPTTAWSVWSGTSTWYAVINPVNYPITFATRPNEIVSVLTGNAWGGGEGNTATKSSKVSVNRPSKPNTSISVIVQIFVYGKLGGVIARLLKRGCYHV